MLVIPDMFQQGDVKILADILLNYFHFSSLFIHKDSVCASVGIGRQTACVVNIGHSKTSVSCVDEGDIIPGTSFHMNFGGDNITELLYELLSKQNEIVNDSQKDEKTVAQTDNPENVSVREAALLVTELSSPTLNIETHYFPSNLNLYWIRDYDIFQKMKETCCQFIPKNQMQTYAFHLFSSIPPTGRPRVSGSLISINISPKIPVLAAFGLFKPEILNILQFYSPHNPKRKRYPKLHSLLQYESYDLLWLTQDGSPKETPNLCPHDDVYGELIEKIRETSEEYSAPKKKKEKQ